MERGWRRLCYSVHGMSPEIFLESSLYRLRMGEGTCPWLRWLGSVEEENSHQPRKLLVRIQFGKLQIQLVRIGCTLMCNLFVVCQLDCFFKQGKRSVEYFYMKALACLAPMKRTICTLLLSPSVSAFSVCSTIELNAAKHPVYSEMFSVTGVRSRLVSGLTSLIANTHHFHLMALGQMSPLCYGVPIRKRSFSFKEELLCSILQIISSHSFWRVIAFWLQPFSIPVCQCQGDSLIKSCICRETNQFISPCHSSSHVEVVGALHWTKGTKPSLQNAVCSP